MVPRERKQVTERVLIGHVKANVHAFVPKARLVNDDDCMCTRVTMIYGGCKSILGVGGIANVPEDEMVVRCGDIR